MEMGINRDRHCYCTLRSMGIFRRAPPTKGNDVK